MSSHFSANQYDGSFKPVKLQNWQVPMSHKENDESSSKPKRPDTQMGFTEIIANERGHLLSDNIRSNKSPWDTGYVNAWSMPRKIPGNCIDVKTARSTYAQEKLQREYQDTLKGGKNTDDNVMCDVGQSAPKDASPVPPVGDAPVTPTRTPSPQQQRTPIPSESPVPVARSPCPVHGDRTARSPLATPPASEGRRTASPKSHDHVVAM